MRAIAPLWCETFAIQNVRHPPPEALEGLPADASPRPNPPPPSKQAMIARSMHAPPTTPLAFANPTFRTTVPKAPAPTASRPHAP